MPGLTYLVRVKAEVAAVVLTVRVVVCAVEPLMVTAAGMVHVAGSLAAGGVIAQLRLITPVNPLEGVNVMVDVFPDVAPGTTVTAEPTMEKLKKPGDGSTHWSCCKLAATLGVSKDTVHRTWKEAGLKPHRPEAKRSRVVGDTEMIWCDPVNSCKSAGGFCFCTSGTGSAAAVAGNGDD
jgi:hypothetical protein